MSQQTGTLGNYMTRGPTLPLLALLDGTAVVDATDPDDTVWRQVWRTRPRRNLTCRQCGSRLDAVDRSGTRFFRHHRSVDCASVGESAEHLRIKALLAAAVRSAGWTARLEQPVGVRIADVLAVSSQARQVAVEVQLSAQTAATTREHSVDYMHAGVEVLWVVRDRARLGHGAEVDPWLELDDADRAAAPLCRLGRDRTSVWDGTTHRPLDLAVWQASPRRPPLSRMLAAVFDGTVQWLSGVGWVPAHEVEPARLACDHERQARREAQQARDDKAAAERTARERTVTAAAADDPVGHATAVRVAGMLEQAGHSRPRLLKGANRVANAWVVRTQSISIVIDPDPSILGQWIRTKRRRTTARAYVNGLGGTVASAERHDALVGQLHRVHHVDQWRPPPLLLPSPDGGEVPRVLLDAARRVVDLISRHCGPVDAAEWHADQDAWVWTLADGATVALAAATGARSTATLTGEHRVVVHVDRAVLPRDTDRRVIYRNLSRSHLTPHDL